jgi:hypothetical protein
MDDNINRILDGITFSDYFKHRCYNIVEDSNTNFKFKLNDNLLFVKIDRNKYKINLLDFKYKPLETFCYYIFEYAYINGSDEDFSILISNLDSLYSIKIYNVNDKSNQEDNVKIRQFKLEKNVDRVKFYMYRNLITFIYYDNMNNIANIYTNREYKIYNNIIDIVDNKEIIDHYETFKKEKMRKNMTIGEVMKEFYHINKFELKSDIYSTDLQISKLYIQ